MAVDVPGASDISNDTPGLMLNHPKVYVGFYSHSAYDRKDTSIAVNAGMCCLSMFDVGCSLMAVWRQVRKVLNIDPMTGGGFLEQKISILIKRLSVSPVQSSPLQLSDKPRSPLELRIRE